MVRIVYSDDRMETRFATVHAHFGHTLLRRIPCVLETESATYEALRAMYPRATIWTVLGYMEPIHHASADRLMWLEHQSAIDPRATDDDLLHDDRPL